MAIVLDGTANTVTPLNGALGATTPSTVVATTVTDSTGTLRPLVSGTAVASTSGTSIDFTSIPSWVKRITVMFDGVSLNGVSRVQIQIGSGSINSSGYSSGAMQGGISANSTTGILVGAYNAAGDTRTGIIVLALLSSNQWASHGNIAQSDGNTSSCAGRTPNLSGVLDRIRITTVNGTDTFDAGSINIMYE